MDKRTGFQTTAKEMEEAVAEQLRQLDTQTASWHEVSRQTRAVMDNMVKMTEKWKKQGLPTDPLVVSVILDQLQFCHLKMLVARLGVEVTETHKRLTKMEKAVKDLKLAAKY